MKMLEITKEFIFDSAHMLNGHSGLCKNVHGHTYKLQVTLSGNLEEVGSSEGMIIDFKDLKKVINDMVIEEIDHAFIYNINNEEETDIANFLKGKRLKTFPIDGRSTCENLTQVIFNKLTDHIENIVSIKLWETPTSYAEYKPQGAV